MADIPDRLKSVDLENAPLNPGQPSAVKRFIDSYIPMNLTPTKDAGNLGQEMQTKVGEKVADGFFNGDFFKNSVAGKTMKSVENVTNKSFSVGQAEKQEIVHTFKFNFRAVQRNAEFNYSGYFNSDLVYSMDSSTAKISVSKPLDGDTSLSLVSTSNLNQVQFNPTLTLTHNF